MSAANGAGGVGCACGSNNGIGVGVGVGAGVGSGIGTLCGGDARDNTCVGDDGACGTGDVGGNTCDGAAGAAGTGDGDRIANRLVAKCVFIILRSSLSSFDI